MFSSITQTLFGSSSRTTDNQNEQQDSRLNTDISLFKEMGVKMITYEKLKPDLCILAVDDSGSTDGFIFEKEMSLISDFGLKKKCKSKKYSPNVTHWVNPSKNLILWSDTIFVVNSLDFIQPRNRGTNPSTLMPLSQTVPHLCNRPVFVLVTDGEINNHEVNNFITKGDRDLQQFGLVITIIVSLILPDSPLSINVSVIAPILIKSQNVLVFYASTNSYFGGNEECYLIHSKGNTGLVNTSEVPSSWSDCAKYSPNSLFSNLNLTISHYMNPLPPNYLSMGPPQPTDTNDSFTHTIRGINLPLFEKIAQDENNIHSLIHSFPSFDMFSEFVFSLISQFKANGKLEILRKLAKGMEQVAHKEKSTIIYNLDAVNAVKYIQDKLAKVMNENENNHEQIHLLKTRFKELRDVAIEKEKEYRELLNKTARPYLVISQRLLAEIAEAEKSDWTLNSVVNLGCNRAKRAKVSKAVDHESELVIENGHCNGETRCSVCFDEQFTQAILFKNIDSDENISLVEHLVSDPVMNCPLAYGYHSTSVISSSIVCVECAKYLCIRGEDLFHKPVVGYLPCSSLHHPSVKSHMFRVLSASIGNNKVLPHLGLLFLAMVDDLKHFVEWGPQVFGSHTLDFIINELLSTLKSTPSFNDVGDKVILREAMQQLFYLEGAVPLIKMPNNQMLLILRYLSNPQYIPEFNIVDKTSLVNYAKTRFVWDIVSSTLQLIHPNATSEQTAKFNQIIDCYYKEGYSVNKWNIPLKCILKGINPFTSEISTLLFSQQGVEKWKRQIFHLFSPLGLNVDSNPFFDPDHFAYIVSLLLDLEYNRVEKTIEDLAVKDKYFWSMIYTHDYKSLDSKNMLKNASDKLFASYFDITDENDPHYQCPKYIINNGPNSCASRLMCSCGHSFIGDKPRLFQNIQELRDVSNNGRDTHFTQVYGDINPSRKSAHEPLHSVIANILSKPMFVGQKIVTMEMLDAVMTALAHTKGRRGDIYKKRFLIDVIIVMQDFLRVQNLLNVSTGNELVDRSIVHKITHELDKDIGPVVFPRIVDPATLTCHAIPLKLNRKTLFNDILDLIDQ